MARAFFFCFAFLSMLAVTACDERDMSIPTMPTDTADSAGDRADGADATSPDGSADVTTSDSEASDMASEVDLPLEETTEELTDAASGLPTFRTCTDRSFDPVIPENGIIRSSPEVLSC